MARARISYSNRRQSLQEIAATYNKTEKGLRLYFSPSNPSYPAEFATLQSDEVIRQLNASVDELGNSSIMSVLSAVEAAFRVDYVERVFLRKRDVVSTEMRALHARSGNRVSLEDDLLNIWRDNTLGAKQIIEDLKGAFKFRHWLAHGRYWLPKFGRSVYDFQTIYYLADQALNAFPLKEEGSI